jgi:hypothetical protein
MPSGAPSAVLERVFVVDAGLARGKKSDRNYENIKFKP